MSVVGATDHYGRAELVTLGVRAGGAVLLDRRRVRLIGEGLPGAPHHHEALELELEAATKLVERVRRSVAEHARAAMSTMQASSGARALVLPASPYDALPASLAARQPGRRRRHARRRHPLHREPRRGDLPRSTCTVATSRR